MAKERAVRIIATWFEHGAPKYVEGRVYPLGDETERLVTVYGCAEFVEIDRAVERLQLAVLAARAAEAKLVRAEALHAQAAEEAKTVQQALADASKALLEDGPDKPALVDVVVKLVDARKASALAAETSAAAAAQAAEKADDAGLAIDPLELKKRADTAAKAYQAADEARAATADLEAAAAKLGSQVEIDAVVAAIEITSA